MTPLPPVPARGDGEPAGPADPAATEQESGIPAGPARS
nr:hypothetical protein [Mycobacterium pseudoshottsii]